MRRLIRTLTFLICNMLVACSVSGAGISLFMGPSQLSTLPAPVVAGGGLLVPAEIIRYAGGEITYSNSGSVRFIINENEVEVKTGNNTALVNGVARPMGAAAVSQDGVLFVPLNFLSDMLSLRVSWDQKAEALRLSERTNVPKNDEPKAESSPVLKPVKLPPLATPLPIPLPNEAEVLGPLPVAISDTNKQLNTNTTTPIAGSRSTTTQAVSLNQIKVGSDLPDSANRDAQGRGDNITPTEVKVIWPSLEGSSITMLAAVDAGVSKFIIKNVPAKAVDAFYVPAPHRIVIDIDGYTPPVNLEAWQVNHPNVNRVRVAPYRGKGRVVLELSEMAGFRVDVQTDGVTVTVNKVLHRADFSPNSAGGRLSLDIPAASSYIATRLGSPDRMVIDLPDTTLSGITRDINFENGPVKTLRVSQFNPQTVRVVLDLAGNVSDPYRSGGDLLQLAFHTEIRKIGLVDIGSDRQLIIIEGEGVINGNLFYLKNPDRIVFDVESAWASDRFGTCQTTSLIRELRAGQFSPQTFRIVANVGARVQARVVELTAGKLGILVEPPTLRGSRIVLDAGHGGSDPGAIGSYLRESDVNLAIAQELETLLSKADANVLLTRSDNSHVFLDQRPVLATRFQPDIFVSIHANSSTEGLANGTETLYWNTENASKQLASDIQNELVSAIGTANRGVKLQNLLVLREAKVPATLVEVGFVSNLSDESKLADAAFRRKAAEGIFAGIVRFLQPDGSKTQDTAPIDHEALWQQVQHSDVRQYLPVNQTIAGTDVVPAPSPRQTNPERNPLPPSDELSNHLHSGLLR